MFRPNRIGTPGLHNSSSTGNTAVFTLSEEDASNSLFPFNVINSTSVADFGKSALNWAGPAVSQTASFKSCFSQQFTITAPLAGDAVGVEIMGAMSALLPANCMVRPIIFRQSAAISVLLQGTSSYDMPTPVAPGDPGIVGVNTAIYRQFYYKTQVVIANGNPNVLSGTYGHGFQIFNNGPAFNHQAFNIVCAVRQLNDQQGIGYRDTLR